MQEPTQPLPLHEQYDLQAELEQQYQLLLDKDQSLEDRLEAFEFITDSEVGDTPLMRGRNLERELGFRQVYLKLEGSNPTGTQKDRIAFAQCADALRRGFDGICLATCGNYGVACALAAKYSGLDCVIYIPEAYHTRRAEEMRQLGAKTFTIKGDYEDAVMASQKHAGRIEYYDANPGGDNTMLQLKAYGEIAYEIYDELRDAPKAVAVPVSNGTVLAGIYKGFLSLYRRGKTSRMPIMVAGSSAHKNPIITSFLQKKQHCIDLDPGSIRETEVNEPLINWHSFDGDHGLRALYETNGWARDVSDRSMLRLAKILKEKEGLNVLPAATAGLAALAQPPNPELLQNDRFVVVLTSRK
ncbi:MAG: pyridoxal-phosphate dependent enzyme [Phaeodactylibacter sp.]|nr:pyridoxal-phosphate dependent enzyme [Phaeodactylibacter sp.]MCB9264272.1 pyridoxal-phosphate dependent enzyme [Lewinellaceae bacterium]MCB9290768.1 pyridoxal-phosphate dependent enzyme [Lewinellaceae bacterium]